MTLRNKLGADFLFFLIILLFWGQQSSCKIYSFTGANTNAKTVSIDLFQNRANNAPYQASQLFTEALKNKFSREGNLKLVDNGGDLHFSGNITSYNFTSVAPQANETSSQVRLTMSVNVVFVNNLDPKDKWEQTFSRFVLYPSTQDINRIEESKIEEINTQLVDDVFNKALVKW